MGDNLKKLLIFTAGVGVGVGISWKLMKDKYKAIADEEIRSVKEVYGRKKKQDEGLTKEKHEKETEPEKKEEKKVDRVKTQYSNLAKEYTSPDNRELTEERPYIISPDELGEESYDVIELTLYDDGVLCDDQGEIVRYPDDIVGLDNLKEMGKYEPDCLHVRNDARKCDYEILSDMMSYDEFKKTEEGQRR